MICEQKRPCPHALMTFFSWYITSVVTIYISTCQIIFFSILCKSCIPLSTTIRISQGEVVQLRLGWLIACCTQRHPSIVARILADSVHAQLSCLILRKFGIDAIFEPCDRLAHDRPKVGFWAFVGQILNIIYLLICRAITTFVRYGKCHNVGIVPTHDDLLPIVGNRKMRPRSH